MLNNLNQSQAISNQLNNQTIQFGGQRGPNGGKYNRNLHAQLDKELTLNGKQSDLRQQLECVKCNDRDCKNTASCLSFNEKRAQSSEQINQESKTRVSSKVQSRMGL